jgi:hypothetical protein
MFDIVCLSDIKEEEARALEDGKKGKHEMDALDREHIDELKERSKVLRQRSSGVKM